MFSILDNEWDELDIADVSFRKVDFSHDSAQITVATLLRYAWVYDAGTKDAGDVNKFMREHSHRSAEEKASQPRNPDTDTMHTPWRDKVYEVWVHIFYDVSNFLRQIYDATGHYHPPDHEVFELDFPDCDPQEADNTRVLTRTFDTGIMLIPAHLQPGVVVRMETVSPVNEDGVVREGVKLRGKFSEAKVGEIWFLQKGVEARFYIEGQWKPGSKGLAAVMVFGKLTEGERCD